MSEDDDDLTIPDFLRRIAGEVRVNAPYVAPSIERSAFKPTIVKKKTEPVQSSITRTSKMIASMLSEVEGMIDDVFFANAASRSVYDILSETRALPLVGRAVVARYSPYLEELRQVGRAGCDSQLREGYSAYSRDDINRLVDLVAAIVADADRYVSNSKARSVTVRRPRQINAVKQVRSLKFLREFSALKLVSIDPTKIVGAQVLYTYDTKRRLLTTYVTNSRTGLEVKGASVRRFDKEKSSAKLLRKPEDSLAVLLEAKKNDVDRVVSAIKTKPTVPTGRSNEHTVLLRVI